MRPYRSQERSSKAVGCSRDGRDVGTNQSPRPDRHFVGEETAVCLLVAYSAAITGQISGRVSCTALRRRAFRRRGCNHYAVRLSSLPTREILKSGRSPEGHRDYSHEHHRLKTSHHSVYRSVPLEVAAREIAEPRTAKWVRCTLWAANPPSIPSRPFATSV